MQSSPFNQFKMLLLEFFTLIVVMLLIPLFMYLDLMVLENSMTELSVTEFSQSALVLASSLIFFRLSYRSIKSKGIFLLFAGLFAAMFIREADYFLDHLAEHLWKVLVLILFCFVSYFTYLYRSTIFKPLLEFVNTKSFVFFLLGFLIVMAFSRVFGLRDLWRSIMGEQYNHVFKTAIQESLELLGYTLMFYSAILLFKEQKRLPDQAPEKGLAERACIFCLVKLKLSSAPGIGYLLK